MKKYSILILIFICLLVLFGFGLVKGFLSIKKDKEEAQKQSETIKESYENFNRLASMFNEKNKEFQSEIENVYYETLEKEEHKLHEQLDKISSALENMQREYENVKDICKVTYEDSKVNSYCESMRVSVDSALKIVKSQVGAYNSLVEKYNLWQEENPKHKKLSSYPMVLGEEKKDGKE